MKKYPAHKMHIGAVGPDKILDGPSYVLMARVNVFESLDHISFNSAVFKYSEPTIKGAHSKCLVSSSSFIKTFALWRKISRSGVWISFLTNNPSKLRQKSRKGGKDYMVIAKPKEQKP
jgi:hypothetical protein